jgi:predicted transcriptional regulator
MTTMTTKERILQTLQELPEDATYEDAMYRIYVLSSIEDGLEDIAAGRVVTHQEVRQRLKRWLS